MFLIVLAVVLVIIYVAVKCDEWFKGGPPPPTPPSAPASVLSLDELRLWRQRRAEWERTNRPIKVFGERHVKYIPEHIEDHLDVI